LSRLLTTILALLIATSTVFTQQLLFSEDFNSCSVPASWTVEATGNPDAVWGVGASNNTNSDGTTIDGSCMLIFDDDGTGENTDPWTVSLETPSFNSTGWTSVRLTIDVHFRNYNGAASLQIQAFDGNDYQEVATYQGAGSQTGTQFSEYVTLNADLSFFSNPEMALRIIYDDGADWAWWAGIDNIEVVGEGTAIPVFLETFNDCTPPAGWNTLIEAGESDWQFGEVQNPNATGETSTMNGSCFAYFDDDILGQEAVPSRVTLFSPVLDGTTYAHYYLDFDVILRRYEDLENLSVGVQNVNTGAISWAATYLADMGGPQFNDYVHEVLDLTAYRQPAMRIVFQYSDGGGWGWWVGIDNIKVTAEGIINDLCEQAVPVFLDDECVAGENTFALFTGPESGCSDAEVNGLWYRYEAQQAGLVAVRSNAGYNDLITVFSGSCEAPLQLECTNYDEFGFTGENLLFESESGVTYYIRVSGVRGAFGLSTGEHCMVLESLADYPTPPDNDDCINSIALSIDDSCIEGNNFNASFEGPIPSLNDKSKADIWYQFTTTELNPLEIVSNADFADVLTIYKGECGNLEEVACGHLGQVISLEEPEANTTYYLQVSGYFATLNGTICVAVNTKEVSHPENENCFDAIPVAVDGECIVGTNLGADFSGPASSCDVYLAASVWYSFICPASGKALIETNADFVHAISIFEGDCNNLEEVYCATNPNACNGNAKVEGLQPGQTYLVRISATADYTGVWENGNLCLGISEPTSNEDFQPLLIVGGLECYDNGSAKLNYFISGGIGNYEIQGFQNGEVLVSGTDYVIVVTDEQGCSTSLAGTVDCQVTCAIAAEVLVFGENECPEDYQASVEVVVEGGVPPYEYIWQNGSTLAAQEEIASGYYTVSITDAEGACVAVAGALVPGPTPFEFDITSISPSSSDVNEGSINITFSGGAPPYTFTWLSDGLVVSNEQSPADLWAGNYILEVVDAEGCSFTSEPITVELLNSTTAVEEWLYCKVFPNPASDLVNISWQSQNATVRAVEVFTASGQRLHQQRLSPGASAIALDVAHYPAGVYWLRLQSDRGVLSRKVVVGR
jgi:hypothetical protein